MPNDSSPHLTFSQRNGLEPVPPQLKLGKASAELRRLIEYYIGLEIDKESFDGYEGSYFNEKWRPIALDLHVIFFQQVYDTFSGKTYGFKQRIKAVLTIPSIGPTFDLIEFLVGHSGCSGKLKLDLAGAFVKARAAYRIFDNQFIAAVGSDEQAAAYQRAIADAEAKNASAARKQLIAAGVELRNGNWSGSVRESIHAVEGMAALLAPGINGLAAALSALEKKSHVHGGLKSAFASLYGYSSDEAGVRHALVFNDEAQVDETDALFMLGACASFVSYLLARNT